MSITSRSLRVAGIKLTMQINFSTHISILGLKRNNGVGQVSQPTLQWVTLYLAKRELRSTPRLYAGTAAVHTGSGCSLTQHSSADWNTQCVNRGIFYEGSWTFISSRRQILFLNKKYNKITSKNTIVITLDNSYENPQVQCYILALSFVFAINMSEYVFSKN